MKIGYIIGAGVLSSGIYNGILQQAKAYREALSARGLEVELLNPWDGKRLASFDIIHAFGGGSSFAFLEGQGKKGNTKYILSPIIDSITPNLLYRLYSYIGVSRLNLSTPGFANRKIARSITEIWVRSTHEEKKVSEGLGIPSCKIRKVPICLRIPPELLSRHEKREDACLHVSSFEQPRKNIYRLIEATEKLGIKLYLGGNTSEQFCQSKEYQEKIQRPHVVLLGRLSEQALYDYYSKIKIFALPSLYEGVGMVALEAGVAGAGVVITNQGGPPDYFDQYAQYADPLSENSIAEAIERSMKNQHQPELRQYLLQNFSQNAVGEKLEQAYREVMTKLS